MRMCADVFTHAAEAGVLAMAAAVQDGVVLVTKTTQKTRPRKLVNDNVHRVTARTLRPVWRFKRGCEKDPGLSVWQGRLHERPTH